ncbi:flagella synthesis protein FlgN [Rosenbergiella nectarea]|uniref:flagella synthesis protein FlgN n=1 Tax=Rosenbergiella nectarea TaxID=988801 RepID=UPI001BDA17D0|nr:flagellar export chaperone FlgN [Rosenbergiella nectarea]MBT0731196.1 flagellar biosynthesis protein FlgN [Rosenbergiella nectarea subsp. apis]
MPDRYYNLSTVLNSLYQVLASLGHVMNEEQQQLMTASPDSRRLMSLSEDKQALLVTLTFVEQRRTESENALTLAPPYSDHPSLAALWQRIEPLAQQLAEQNQHTALMLSQQQAWTEQVLNILQPLQAQRFYGPDGHPVMNR